MDFTKKSQPAWPFPQKRLYVSAKVKPKAQPKAAYPDTFSQSVLPKTSQTPWADSLLW